MAWTPMRAQRAHDLTIRAGRFNQANKVVGATCRTRNSSRPVVEAFFYPHQLSPRWSTQKMMRPSLRAAATRATRQPSRVLTVDARAP
jgi:hypothetical protein